MIILVYAIAAFFVLRFLVALVNLVFSPVLKKQETPLRPLISVLIPARNEETNIATLLNDLKNQSYKNIEVIVFNDQSTDRTAEITSDFCTIDKRYRLVHSDELPEGWLGKNNACHQLAKKASGEYLLFLDADVRIQSGLIESLTAQMHRHNLRLISVFPKQIMKTMGEKITVPVMNSILLSLLPMILTRESPRPSLAAANGQLMFFEKNTYLQVWPHEQVKNQMVEDILIARLYKKKGFAMQCMTGNETISCRMYHSLFDSILGFSRNVAEYFGGNHLAALFYWFLGTFGIVFIALFLPFVYFIASLFIVIITKIMVSIVSRQSVWENLLFALPQQLLLGIIVIYSYRNKIQKKAQWKGRNIG